MFARTESCRSRGGIGVCEMKRSRFGFGSDSRESAPGISATPARSGVAFRSFGSPLVPGYASILVAWESRS